MKNSLRALTLTLLAAGSFCVQAQSYPTKPVKIILPFGPGSATDVMTRVLADELRMIYNQPFIIDYKAGASGMIGTEAAAKSAPDGYTLFVGTNSTHSANPFLFKKINYDPIKDFSPISHLVAYSSVLVSNASAPFSNVRELVAYARANPNKVSYGYGNTIAQLGCATLFRTANVQVLPIAYKSNPQAATDVIGGNITLTIIDLASGEGLIKAGKLKPIAGVRDKRSVLLPDLPTVAETPGFEGFGINSWVGLFGPAGVPRPIVDSLSASTRKILTKPEIKARFEAASAELEPSTPDEFRAFIARQLDNWGKRVREAGIEPGIATAQSGMTEQIPLFDAPSPQWEGPLFFSIHLDRETAGKVGQLTQGLRDKYRLKSRPVGGERLHITLYFIGDRAALPPSTVAKARAVAAGIAAVPFEVAFDRVTCFSGKGSKRPVVLLGDKGVIELVAFQKTLVDALKRAGVAHGVAPAYTPHVTLLYDNRDVPEQAIEPVTWTVREFSLMHSLIGESRHVPLERWPLREAVKS